VSKLYGGVETGGTWCACALGTSPDDVRAHTRFRTGTPEETLGRIVTFFEAEGIPAALGIGAFGPLDLDPASPTWGTVTSTPKPGWRNTPIAPALAQRLGVPVAVDTDVGAAALAESRWGAGRGIDSLCYLTVGTGIGAGLIAAGRPWHGLVHPEVGHLRVPHNRSRDPFDGVCPIHGACWEGLASGPALAARWDSDPAVLAADHPAWELEAEYLALGLLAIVSVASPRRVVAGGGVFGQGGLRGRVSRRLAELIGGYFDTPLLSDRVEEYLVAPALGERAGVLGGIALAQAVA
jgi:fructokinase